MLAKRFSEMSEHELIQEIALISKKREESQFPSEKEQLASKSNAAKSYLLLLQGVIFPKGQYRIDGLNEQFRLEYVNGIMAWGSTEVEKEACYPLALLAKDE
jgi:hypothetical protein